MNETFPQCHPFHVEVEGVVEAHADDLAEARLVAFHLRDASDEDGGFVAVVDELDHSLVLGWWLDSAFVGHDPDAFVEGLGLDN